MSFAFSFALDGAAAEEGPGTSPGAPPPTKRSRTAAPGVGDASMPTSSPALPLEWVVPPAALLSPHFNPSALPTLDAGYGLRRCVVDADGVTGVSRDVVSGLYEGGAKVWECTRDLLSHLAAAQQQGQPLVRPGATVVADVGCGAGLLGIATLLAGARACLFSDMNAPVLAHVTAPNVAVNLGADGFSRAALMAGPWASVVAAARRAFSGDASDTEARLRPFLGSVDLVLASEVLYNVAYYDDLCALLRALLRPGSGVALIATKRFYYGVGGGTEAFIRVATEPGRHGLTVNKLAAFQDGASMVRDLLEVRLLPPAAAAAAHASTTALLASSSSR